MSEPAPVSSDALAETSVERQRRNSADAVANAIQRASQSAVAAAEKALEAWEHVKKQKSQLHEDLKTRRRLVRAVPFFASMHASTMENVVKRLDAETFEEGEEIIKQGEVVEAESDAPACFLIERGVCHAKVLQADGSWEQVAQYEEGSLFGEQSLIHRCPHEATVTAASPVKALVLSARIFSEMLREREYRERRLRRCRMLADLSEGEVGKLAGALECRRFADGQMMIVQGTAGAHIFVLDEGSAVATIRMGEGKRSMKQAVMLYHEGEIFGELAVLEGKPRAASVMAKGAVTVYTFSRDDFEQAVGPISRLQPCVYLRDPRQLLHDFFRPGDGRGPAGALKARNLVPTADASEWFAVYRPCSSDAITQMLSRKAVGKGRGVQGKVAAGRLSGFVPYVQISENRHKAAVGPASAAARTKIYFQSRAARDIALEEMTTVLTEGGLDITAPRIEAIDAFEPQAFGLDVPEPLVREVYIMRPDMTPVQGWETGRKSEPAFMDMNMRATRGGTGPSVVLYQYDDSNPMNPGGLLMAYEEEQVKPVVASFQTFTVGSCGVRCAPLPPDQVALMQWCLERCAAIMGDLHSACWMARWLDLLQRDARSGASPQLPSSGAGDHTTQRIMGEVVEATRATGAVRAGADCFNFYLPQDLEKEFLVVWDGFTSPPWKMLTEPELRQFLLERIKEGYSFPFHPVWAIRDPGWYDVLQELRKAGSPNIKSWLPPEKGILEKIDALHAAHPNGYLRDSSTSRDDPEAPLLLMEDMSSDEMASFVEEAVRNVNP